MKAKKYLLQIRRADMIIKNKMHELEKLKEMALNTAVNNSGDRVQVSSIPDKMAEVVCRYLDEADEIQQRINQQMEKKKEIISTIEQLDNSIEYDILHKIYVQHYELYELADMYEKSYSWCASMQGNALKHLQDILDERGDNNE